MWWRLYCNNKSSWFSLIVTVWTLYRISWWASRLNSVVKLPYYTCPTDTGNKNWPSPQALIHKPWLFLPNPTYYYSLTLLDLLLIDTATLTACPKPSHFGKLPITASTECISVCMSTVPQNAKWHWTAACLGQRHGSMAHNICRLCSKCQKIKWIQKSTPTEQFRKNIIHCASHAQTAPRSSSVLSFCATFAAGFLSSAEIFLLESTFEHHI